MKKILTYSREQMFHTVGKIVFAAITFYVMQFHLFPAEWGLVFDCLLVATAGLILIHNLCVSLYKEEEQRQGSVTPAIVIGVSFFLIASGLYVAARVFEDPADDRLRVINVCYYILIINILFSFAEFGIEKYRIRMARRSGVITV
jgi:ABC-type transport system involved in cytochrome c biogenesis permease component